MSDMVNSETFSRHVNEQHRWQEALIQALVSLDFDARRNRLTQAQYLTQREALFTGEAQGLSCVTKLTDANRAYCRGFERGLQAAMGRDIVHCWRIEGQPETATAARWDDMPEPVRQACREHRAESCLCWDTEGRFPW